MKKSLLVLSLVALLGLLGCSDDEPTGGGGGGGNVAGGGAPGGGGPGGPGGGGPGGGAIPDTLFPLVVGLEWTYENETELAPGLPCSEKEYGLKVSNKVAGTAAGFNVMPNPATGMTCFPVISVVRFEEGKLISSGDKELVYISDKLEKGHKWMSRTIEFEWIDHLDSIETPAGTFKDCWVRGSSDFEDTFCRKIGLVKRVAKKAMFTLTLKKKSFE